MIRTCKVKLGRASKQEARLIHILELCRWLYNAALQQRIEAWDKQRVSVSRYDQQKELTILRSEYEEYRVIPVNMTRLTTLTRLDEAFKGFFRRVKRGEKPGFPRFKSKNRFDTLIFDKTGWKIEGKKFVVNVGPEPIILHMKNEIYREGEIISLRIVKSATRWWAHFDINVGPAPEVKKSKNGIGIDVGLRTFATMSDGTIVEHPRFLRHGMDRLCEAQQVISRKYKGSKNRARAKVVLASIHEKIANRRLNFIHQAVADLTKKYDGFAIENLNVQGMINVNNVPEGMTKKASRGLRRGIMDSAWSLFGTCLENKAEEAGFPVVRVDPKGTSQRCSACGTLVRKTLRDRVHECHACGLVLDRDENAARNIFNLGYRLVSGDMVVMNCVEGTEVSSLR